MVRQDRVLRARCEIIDSSKRIIVPRTNSFYRAIPADAEGTHGINAHGVIFDELHTQPDRKLYDVLTTSQGAQLQPLTVFFTTAGFDRATICGEEHDRAEKIASGALEDPSYLPVIYAAGQDDDWADPKTWRKANPMYDALGIAFQEDLAHQAKRAKESPAFRNTFLRLHNNIWTKQQTTWLPMERWDATAGLVNLAELADRHCTIGAWLASSTELATVVLLFPPAEEGGEYVVHMDTFAPADNIEALADRDKAALPRVGRPGLAHPHRGRHHRLRRDPPEDRRHLRAPLPDRRDRVQPARRRAVHAAAPGRGPDGGRGASGLHHDESGAQRARAVGARPADPPRRQRHPARDGREPRGAP